MSGVEVGSLIAAIITVVTCIGTNVILAFRVGRFTGDIGSTVKHGEEARQRLWAKLDDLNAKVDRHVENGHKA